VILTDEGTRAGWSDARSTNPSFAELTRERLENAGVPAEAIVILPRPGEPAAPTRTVAETRGVVEWARRHDVHSLIVVTSSYHSRRTSSSFAHIAGGRMLIGIEGACSACCGHWWWRSSEGWRTIPSEYAKLAYQSLLWQFTSTRLGEPPEFGTSLKE